LSEKEVHQVEVTLEVRNAGECSCPLNSCKCHVRKSNRRFVQQKIATQRLRQS